MNGHLYAHITTMLRRFCTKMKSTTSLKFILYGSSALDLPKIILNTNPSTPSSFDRIEVSNVADPGYIGLKDTLSALGSLLKSPSDNQHATLLTLFMNAVHNFEETLGESYKQETMPPRMRQVAQFLPTPIPKLKYDPYSVQFISAGTIFRDNEDLFKHWMKSIHAEDIMVNTGMSMRAGNKVIDKWPVGKVDGVKDFRLLLQSGGTGAERHVEWVRKERGVVGEVEIEENGAV